MVPRQKIVAEECCELEASLTALLVDGSSNVIIEAWRKACRFVHAQVPVLCSAEAATKQALLRVLDLTLQCAKKFTGNHECKQLEQAKLQFAFLRALHQQRALEGVLPVCLALIDFLRTVGTSGAAQTRDSLWDGSVTIALAAFGCASEAGAFAQLSSIVIGGTEGSSSQSVWLNAYRLLVSRLKKDVDGSAQLSKEELSSAFSLLATATSHVDQAVALQALPHLMKSSSTAALQQLVTNAFLHKESSLKQTAAPHAVAELSGARCTQTIFALEGRPNISQALVYLPCILWDSALPESQCTVKRRAAAIKATQKGVLPLVGHCPTTDELVVLMASVSCTARALENMTSKPTSHSLGAACQLMPTVSILVCCLQRGVDASADAAARFQAAVPLLSVLTALQHLLVVLETLPEQAELEASSSAAIEACVGNITGRIWQSLVAEAMPVEAADTFTARDVVHRVLRYALLRPSVAVMCRSKGPMTCVLRFQCCHRQMTSGIGPVPAKGCTSCKVGCTSSDPCATLLWRKSFHRLAHDSGHARQCRRCATAAFNASLTLTRKSEGGAAHGSLRTAQQSLQVSLHALSVIFCHPLLWPDPTSMSQLSRDTQKRAHLACRAKICAPCYAMEHVLLLQAMAVQQADVRSQLPFVFVG
jgi:hypothetical protein